MKRKLKEHGLRILFLVFLIGVLSCDSTDFVYVDDKTFHKQLLRLNEGIVEVVLQLDPEQKGYHETYVVPRQVIKEKKLTTKSKTSNELCKLISIITKRNEKYLEKEWYPTYTIYIKYTDKFLYYISKDTYIRVSFDFKNPHISISGRKFVITKDEAARIKEKLNKLLTNVE